jgi:AAA15 family ATPase/GTPase
VIGELNRDNSLFLSAAAQNNHTQLTPVYSWFTKSFWGVSPSVNIDQLQKRLSSSQDERLVPFLRNADTGISRMNVSSEDPPESIRTLYKTLQDVVKSHAVEEGIKVDVAEPQGNTTVTLSHFAVGGSTVELPLAKESRGTRRLMNLLLSAFKVLDIGGVLVVDELDSSLHTLLSMKLLDLFGDSSINPHGAQMIATTHDTNILCSDKVRRDQIWFVEKDAEGASHLYPLTDIRTRNTDNLEKGYLQGRFGAVPFLGSVKDLCAEAHSE